MDILKDFVLTSVSGRIPDSTPVPHTDALAAAAPQPAALSPLGVLAELVGTWKGTGFNQIWRPFHGNPPAQDRFLELNETMEVLQFDAIPGDIPNRGFKQNDINLHGIRYLQQIQDRHVLGPNGKPAGIHIEPGLWINIPATTNPADPPTVARLANIPHGTSFVAQGTELPVLHGPPPFAPVSIKPFPVGNPNAPINFPEQTLANPTQFRTPHADIPKVTQAMVDNPNVVLADGIAHKTITSTRTLRISTSIQAVHPPSSGGGTSNIAFLKGLGINPENADAVQMDAIFWIETFKDAHGTTHKQLQYSQIVQLVFNTLSWPHVSVATLIKQ
jgi:hypothetical protein